MKPIEQNIEHNSNELLNEFNKDIGILSSNEYSTTPQEIIDKIENNVKGTDVDIRNQIEEIFFSNVYDYITETFNGILYSDIKNSNSYIKNNLGRELQTISKRGKDAINAIHRNRQMYFEKLYQLNKNNNTSNVIKITMLSIILSFIFLQLSMQKRVSFTYSYIFIGVILIIYLILIIVNIKTNRMRGSEWNKFNFKVKPPKNKN